MKKVKGGARDNGQTSNKHNNHENKTTQQNLPTKPITESTNYTHYNNKGTRKRHTLDTTSTTQQHIPIDNAVKNQAYAIRGQKEWYTDTTGTPGNHRKEAEGNGERAALKQTAKQ